eukprot:scaffold553575_cov18-Prasinocladus_malaysianus.AAC.1
MPVTGAVRTYFRGPYMTTTFPFCNALIISFSMMAIGLAAPHSSLAIQQAVMTKMTYCPVISLDMAY